MHFLSNFSCKTRNYESGTSPHFKPIVYSPFSYIQQPCACTCRGGFPGGQPVSLDRQNVHLLGDGGRAYLVSWKADGTRYVCYMDERGGVFMLDRDNTVFHVDHLDFVRRFKDPAATTLHPLVNTLLDGVCTAPLPGWACKEHIPMKTICPKLTS